MMKRFGMRGRKCGAEPMRRKQVLGRSAFAWVAASARPGGRHTRNQFEKPCRSGRPEGTTYGAEPRTGFGEAGYREAMRTSANPQLSVPPLLAFVTSFR